MLLKNQWVNDEIKKEILQYLETNDKNNHALSLEWSKSSSLREVHSDTFLPQKQEKSQPTNLNYHFKKSGGKKKGKKT